MITREVRYRPPALTWLGQFGRRAIDTVCNVGRGTLLFLKAFLMLPQVVVNTRSRRETVMQFYLMGIKSLPVVTVVAVFTGMILSLQTGLELRRFNQEVFIGSAVMVSMLREMGPFMTGLILAACVGSSIAAQMGTMVVNDEVAALEIMSIDPVRFLVLPRMAAMMLITPMMSFYTCMMGMLGGGIVGATQLNVAWNQYVTNALDFAQPKDLYVGLFKALLFGILITVIACYEGFTTTQGALGVGFSTRRAVIASFLAILVVGYFVTRLFYV